MFFSRDKTVIRPREAHNISRKNIDPDALRVLYRLSGAGFTAYLVGGSVRDLLMGRQPKDFDISTDAHPNQVRRLFRNCYLVGRRFRLAHVIFGRKVIETSTFRKPPQAGEADEGVPGGLYQHEDNTFGTPEEDAKRRDFTVNGLFYDIRTFSVIDYVGGLRDIERRTLRSIGDPNIRFREDPVRMMRAVRFAARLDFGMDWSCRRALRRHHAEILNASTPRLLEEIMRLFGHNCAAKAFRLLWEYRLMSVLLPEVHTFVERTGGSRSPLWRYLDAFDKDPCNAEASNGLRVAMLYAPLYRARIEGLAGGTGFINGYEVAQEILEPLARRMTLPRQTFFTACMLLDGQRRFEEGARRARRMRMVRHDLFQEALALRRIVLTAAEEDLASLREWEALAEQAQRQVQQGRDARQGPPPQAAEAPEPGAPVAPDEEIAEGEDEAEQPPEAEGVPPPRRRRRRRRGRGRRGPPAGEPSATPLAHAPQPPQEEPAPSRAPAAAPPAPPPGTGGDADRPADAG
jgi:poly(A) polymerase